VDYAYFGSSRRSGETVTIWRHDAGWLGHLRGSNLCIDPVQVLLHQFTLLAEFLEAIGREERAFRCLLVQVVGLLRADIANEGVVK
jgi:hypothetical protein